MKSRYLIITVTSMASSLLFGNELPRQLDLPHAVTLAIENNPSLKTTQAQLREQQGVIREFYSGRKPKFNLTANGTEIDDARLQNFGDFTPETTSWNAGAEARITVFSGGRSIRAINSQKARHTALKDRYETERQQLAADVHEAYLQAQLASDKIMVQEEVIDVLAEQQRFTQNRLDAGVGEPFDLKQAIVALANARPPLIRAQNDYRRGVDQLRRLIGLPFPAETDARDIVLDPVDPPDILSLRLDDALANARLSRPEFSELEAMEEAAQLQLEAVKREQRPLVDLFADYGAQSDDFGGSDYLNGWRAGVQMNMPLGDGGKTRGRTEQAEAQLAQVQHQRQATEIAIAGEVRQAYFDYEEAKSILGTSGQVTEQAEEALRLSQNRYKVGKGTQLDVLQAQLQLTQSTVEDVTALNTLQSALVRIKRAAGLPLITEK